MNAWWKLSGPLEVADFAMLHRGDMGACAVANFALQHQALLDRITAGGFTVLQVSLHGRYRGVPIELCFGNSLQFPASLVSIDLGVVVRGQEPVGGSLGDEGEVGWPIWGDGLEIVLKGASEHSDDCKRPVVDFYVGGQRKGVVLVGDGHARTMPGSRTESEVAA